ncbi:hypothetical protein BD777DRAFT_10549 [Yarrowia lipolytica]|nr:hypothetical protein BD777DRAFT_10549 [Yarrowia lipolytica]
MSPVCSGVNVHLIKKKLPTEAPRIVYTMRVSQRSRNEKNNELLSSLFVAARHVSRVRRLVWSPLQRCKQF